MASCYNCCFEQNFSIIDIWFLLMINFYCRFDQFFRCCKPLQAVTVYAMMVIREGEAASLYIVYVIIPIIHKRSLNHKTQGNICAHRSIVSIYKESRRKNSICTGYPKKKLGLAESGHTYILYGTNVRKTLSLHSKLIVLNVIWFF